MKLLTKEWYEACQITAYPLRATDKAAQFSEAYFQALYRRKLKCSLRMMWKCSKEYFDLAYPERPILSEEDFTSPEAYAQACRTYLREREAALKKWQPEPFDEAEETDEFEREYQENLDFLTRTLPEEVRGIVADMRVLALGEATPEVRRQVNAFFRARRKWIKDVEKEYDRQKRAFVKRHPDFPSEWWILHDARVAQVRKEDSDLWIQLEGALSEDARNAWICFDQCDIVKMEAPLKDAEWLYGEVYDWKESYEAHVLFFDMGAESDRVLKELIVRSENVRIVKRHGNDLK